MLSRVLWSSCCEAGLWERLRGHHCPRPVPTTALDVGLVSVPFYWWGNSSSVTDLRPFTSNQVRVSLKLFAQASVPTGEASAGRATVTQKWHGARQVGLSWRWHGKSMSLQWPWRSHLSPEALVSLLLKWDVGQDAADLVLASKCPHVYFHNVNCGYLLGEGASWDFQTIRYVRLTHPTWVTTIFVSLTVLSGGVTYWKPNFLPLSQTSSCLTEGFSIVVCEWPWDSSPMSLTARVRRRKTRTRGGCGPCPGGEGLTMWAR